MLMSRCCLKKAKWDLLSPWISAHTSPIMVVQKENQGIMLSCKDSPSEDHECLFHSNPSSGCWDISVWNKVVDWPNNPTSAKNIKFGLISYLQVSLQFPFIYYPNKITLQRLGLRHLVALISLVKGEEGKRERKHVVESSLFVCVCVCLFVAIVVADEWH